MNLFSRSEKDWGGEFFSVFTHYSMLSENQQFPFFLLDLCAFHFYYLSKQLLLHTPIWKQKHYTGNIIFKVHNRWRHLYQVGIKHYCSLELLTNAQNISPSNWLPNKKRSRCLAWSLDITCIPVNLFRFNLRNSEEKLSPPTFPFQNKGKQ